MRPEKCVRIVNKEMRRFYNYNIINLPDLSILSCFKKRDVYKALKILEKKYETRERRLNEEYGFFNGNYDDMYPDVVTIKDILSNFNHIADRWRCVGRIRFILRVIDNLEKYNDAF